MKTSAIYQRIGEYVVSFQWLEHRFREIGWLILDPKRKEWPPKALLEESSFELAQKVCQLYCELVKSLNETELEEDFITIVEQFHRIRRHRNAVLHSAYYELKAGGEVVGIARSNLNPRGGNEIQQGGADHELLSPESFSSAMLDMAEVGFALNVHYVQCIRLLQTGKQPLS